jgi:hypothetical protein
MAKINPGKCNEFIPAVFVVLAVIYAGVLGRLDVLVLSTGVGLICYGLKMPIYNTLFIVGAATFLASYLPFGMGEQVVPNQKGVRENFANNDRQDGVVHDNDYFEDKGEDFQDKEEEFKDKEEEFKNTEEEFVEEFKNTEEEFEEENFEEGFKNVEEDFEEENFDEENFEEENFEEENFEEENFEEENFEEENFEEENFDEENFEEGFANEKKKKKNNKVKKVNPPPNNGERAEPFVLGKKYKMPSEDDDEDYHLDAGTTFLNAYKSLNPDQISAMTKDTQDLINTQKQLMSTLNTLKPLITDGKQMMETFGSFMGGDGGGLGDLSKMAEKFAGAGK